MEQQSSYMSLECKSTLNLHRCKCSLDSASKVSTLMWISSRVKGLSSAKYTPEPLALIMEQAPFQMKENFRGMVFQLSRRKAGMERKYNAVATDKLFHPWELTVSSPYP